MYKVRRHKFSIFLKEFFIDTFSGYKIIDIENNYCDLIIYILDNNENPSITLNFLLLELEPLLNRTIGMEENNEFIKKITFDNLGEEYKYFLFKKCESGK